MIKYNTQIGAKHLNQEAREYRDVIKPKLSKMRCGKCKTDTIISFVDNGYGQLTHHIDACCPNFKQRINQKIMS